MLSPHWSRSLPHWSCRYYIGMHKSAIGAYLHGSSYFGLASSSPKTEANATPEIPAKPGARLHNRQLSLMCEIGTSGFWVASGASSSSIRARVMSYRRNAVYGQSSVQSVVTSAMLEHESSIQVLHGDVVREFSDKVDRRV